MNWNGGALSRSRNADASPSAAQKRHFAKARAKQSRLSLPDLDFSALEHARFEECSYHKRSPAHRRVEKSWHSLPNWKFSALRNDRTEDRASHRQIHLHPQDIRRCYSSKAISSSPNKQVTPIPSSSSAFISSPASSSSRKERFNSRGSYEADLEIFSDTSLGAQKQKLLAVKDWCGLKTTMPIRKAYPDIADTGPDGGHILGNYRQGNKRQRPASSEGSAHRASTTDKGGPERKLSSYDRDSQSTEQIIRAASESSPSQNIHANLSLNSDKNLFADELINNHTNPPLSDIVFDWSNIKWDTITSAHSPSDNVSIVEEPCCVDDILHPSNRLFTETLYEHPSSGYGFKRPDRPISERGIIDIESALEKKDAPSDAGPPYGSPTTYAERPLSFMVELTTVKSSESTPSVREKIVPDVTLSPLNALPADSSLHTPGRCRALNTGGEEASVIEKSRSVSSLYDPMVAKIEDSTKSTEPMPRRTDSEKLLPLDSEWKDFVIGNEDECAADDEYYDSKCIIGMMPQAIAESDEGQQPDSGCKDFVVGNEDKGADDEVSSTDQREELAPSPLQRQDVSSAPSSPHQFAFLYSDANDKVHSINQQKILAESRMQPREVFSTPSGPHQFASLYSSTKADHSSSPNQPNSPYRESSDELQQPAKRFLKPIFVFTKPARFVGDRADAATLPPTIRLGDSRRRPSDENIILFPKKWDKEEVKEVEEEDDIEEFI